MRTAFILFGLAALAVVAGSHYLIYQSAVRFFPVLGRHRLALALGLASLALGFIVFSVLAHYQTHFLVKLGYLLSGYWYGIIIYLLIAFAVGWLVVSLGRFFPGRPGPGRIVVVLLAAAFLFSLYGLYNGRRLTTVRLRVPVENLPAAWQGQTLAFISDVHAGLINRGEFLTRLVAKINAAEPAAVLIGGDYFDGTGARFEELAAPLSALSAPTGVYFVTGNHETYLDTDRALAALSANGVRVLRDEKIAIDGLQIIGLDYPARGGRHDPAAALGDFDTGRPGILLAHEPRYHEAAMAAGIDLGLAGHIHRGQIFPFNLITRILYGPWHYGAHRQGEFTNYTTSGVGTWGPPLRTVGQAEIVLVRLE